MGLLGLRRHLPQNVLFPVEAGEKLRLVDRLHKQARFVLYGDSTENRLVDGPAAQVAPSFPGFSQTLTPANTLAGPSMTSFNASGSGVGLGFNCPANCTVIALFIGPILGAAANRVPTIASSRGITNDQTGYELFCGNGFLGTGNKQIGFSAYGAGASAQMWIDGIQRGTLAYSTPGGVLHGIAARFVNIAPPDAGAYGVMGFPYRGLSSDIAVPFFVHIDGLLTDEECRYYSQFPLEALDLRAPRQLVGTSAREIPLLSAPGVFDITTTSARPRVTVTF